MRFHNMDKRGDYLLMFYDVEGFNLKIKV